MISEHAFLMYSVNMTLCYILHMGEYVSTQMLVMLHVIIIL